MIRRYLVLETTVRFGVLPVQRRAENGNRPTPGLDGRLVGYGVYPHGQAAHYGNALACKHLRYGPGFFHSTIRRPSGTHHGHSGRVERNLHWPISVYLLWSVLLFYVIESSP